MIVALDEEDAPLGVRDEARASHFRFDAQPSLRWVVFSFFQKPNVDLTRMDVWRYYASSQHNRNFRGLRLQGLDLSYFDLSKRCPPPGRCGRRRFFFFGALSPATTCQRLHGRRLARREL